MRHLTLSSFESHAVKRIPKEPDDSVLWHTGSDSGRWRPQTLFRCAWARRQAEMSDGWVRTDHLKLVVVGCPFNGDVFLKSQQTYTPDLILAISGWRGSQEQRSREGGLGPCCTCKEKGLGLMGPHTWVPLMLGRCSFPSLDLVEICAISTIRFCGQFRLTGLQCDGRKRRWTLLKECLRNVEPLQVWLFGCCKMLSY